MKRGDIVIVALAGDLGKPRPALIVQSDRFSGTGTVLVVPFSGTPIDAPLIRPPITPDAGNGLRKPSRVMVDKIIPVRRDKIKETIGTLDAVGMLEVTRLLTVFLGIG